MSGAFEHCAIVGHMLSRAATLIWGFDEPGGVTGRAIGRNAALTLFFHNVGKAIARGNLVSLGIWAAMVRTGYLAPVCGAIALACVMSWPHLASYRKAVVVQTLGAGAFALQFASLDAWTASGTSVLACAQLVCAASSADRRLVRAVCASCLLALVALTVVTWEGIPSLLAVCGSTAGSLARLQRSTTRMKLMFLLGAPFWVLHNLSVGAIFALCVDAVSIAGNGISLVRTAKRRGLVVCSPTWLFNWACRLPQPPM